MVEPLRKRRPDGTPYRRRPAVERELQEIESLELAEVVAHARAGEQQGKVSVSSEALMYILRREVRSATTHAPTIGPIDGLLSLLIQRCETILKRRLARYDDFDREAIAREVIDRVVDEIYDDRDLADYAEVNFNDWLSHNRSDACRKQQRKAARTERLGESVEDLSEEEAQIISGDGEAEESPDRSPEAIYALNEAREKANLPAIIEKAQLSPDDKYRIGAMVKRANLPADVLYAFLAYHYLEMQIESEDLDKHTLVKHFGKSEKTIRLWIKRAEKVFAKLREMKNESDRNETSEPGIGASRLSR